MNISKNKIKFLFFILGIILICLLTKYISVKQELIEPYLKRFPLVYSGIVFIILYVIGTFFVWFSKDIFRVTAAILFGAYFSTLFVWIAEIINAFVLFYLARILGRDFVEKKYGTRQKNLDEKLENISFFWLFMFRIVPLVPFRFLDLACGLTKINFKKYLMAVIFGSPLRIFWLQYILAGVGKSVFGNPYVLSVYLMQNKLLYIFSLVYIILVVIVALRLRRN